MARLRRGDLLPRIVVPPPGPRARALALELRRCEAPGSNTWLGGEGGVPWLEARGACVLDPDGNRYLDFTSGFGVAAVGHRNPRVVAAVERQARLLLHGLGDAAGHPVRAALAARLAALVPVPDPQVYFAVSGSDAVEIALKTAVLATGRPGILAFAGAYHGLTLGALHATSRAAFRRPFRAHFHPHLHRLPFGAPEEAIASLFARHPEIGCALVEPVLGREGVVLPPPGWLAALARTCRDHHVLLAADEILTGFGRTGALFAVSGEGVRPDLLCCGKALGGGLPIAAVVGRRDLLAHWERGGEALHTATFVAHPLACAAALATLAILRRERLPARARRLGRSIAKRLAALAAARPRLAVRGRGMLWAVELPDPAAAAAARRGALRQGLLLLQGGPRGTVLQIAPPLTIAERQLAAGLDLLASALR